jgi:glyoxylase-like metal-dependent hydrolase (beta-lactamase superfamily II)
MSKRIRWVGWIAIAQGLSFAACHEASQTPAELPTASPVSESPTASPDPPMAPAAAVTPDKKTKLELEVITGSEKGFLVNSTLVTGKRDAVLIDAQFTLPDAAKVAEAVAASGKKLTFVYVTHFHPDHYFGFPVIKAKFPNAKLIALPQTVELIQKTWEEKVKQWEPLYKESITTKPIVPEPLAGGSIDLEGQKLEIHGGQQGDSPDNAFVWIPSLRTVVTGDIAYDGVFPWTAETTPAERKAWAATLDKIKALGAELVVPGHQKPDRTYKPSNLDFTKQYLAAYDEALASAKSAADLQARIKARYPDTALDAIVRIAAEAEFPAKSSKKKGPAEQKAPATEKAKP